MTGAGGAKGGGGGATGMGGGGAGGTVATGAGGAGGSDSTGAGGTGGTAAGGSGGSATGAGGAGGSATGAGGAGGSQQDAAADLGTGAGGAAGGPLAHYTMDDATGAVAHDSSPNHLDGALMGTAQFGTGMIGGDLVLDGTSGSYVSLPAGMLSSAQQATIAVWVNVRTLANWARIFDFGADATTNMFLTPQNSQTSVLRFAITTGGNASEQRLDGAAPLPTGSWHHVAVVLTGAGGTLYLDGQVAATNTALTLVPSMLGATANDWLGRSQYTADPYLDGQIDDLVIYARALSAQEIAAVYAQR
jgi:hypothetical protein